MRKSKAQSVMKALDNRMLLCQCAHNPPGQSSNIDYEALGISPPKEDDVYIWKPAMFNIDMIDIAVTMNNTEDGDECIMIRIDGMSFIIKGNVDYLSKLMK